MSRKSLMLKSSIFLIIIANVNFIQTQNSESTVVPQCPPNYKLTNGLCYYNGNRCPDGYHFHTDGLCYPIEQKPCPFENITTTTSMPITTSSTMIPTTSTQPTTTTTTPSPTTTTTTTPSPTTTTTTTTPSTTTTTTTTTPSPTTTSTTTTTTPPPTTTTTTPPPTTTSTTTEAPEPMPPIIILPPPEMDEQLRCPSDSIFIDKKCRKIICSLGEYHMGQCLQPACPPGLVWRGKSCQEPGYVTTILEIDNIFVNQINEKSFAIEKSDVNKIVYHTTTTTTRKPCTTRSPTTIRTTRRRPSTTITTTTKKDGLGESQNYDYSCCTVITPRICKLYGEKWVCFNRRYNRCDSRICTSPVVYLKAPEIKYEPPVLIMPPNPPLDSCTSNNCNTTDTVDCSGCARNHPEQCSSYCYRYMCPEATCSYMDLDIYCSYYPGQFGCLKEDGCLWNWC